MHTPTKPIGLILKGYSIYLKGTLNHGLMIHKSRQLNVIAFSDVGWRGNLDYRSSTIGNTVFLGSTSIYWKSSKQKKVARSSIEVEYRALTNAASEALWLTNLLNEVHVKVPRQPVLLCDNIRATYLSSNPVFHSCIKHLTLDYHFVW